MNGHERWEDALRQGLEQEATRVEITGDGLENIRMRTAGAARRRIRLALAGAAGLAAAAVGVAVALGPDDAPDVISPAGTSTSSPASPSNEPTTPPTTEPTPDVTTIPPGEQRPVPVYFTFNTDQGLRLAREFRSTTSGRSNAEAALELMRDGPVDPDYTTFWDASVEVLSVQTEGGTATVDLSGDWLLAPSLQGDKASNAVEQLIFTVQGALGERLPVQILVDGEHIAELWGTVPVAEPLTNADPMSVRMLVQINSPGEGDAVASPVRVTGEAAAFEATVPWRVLRADTGEVVEQNFTNAAEGQRLSPFAFEVTLTPGDYIIEVTEDDPSGGEGRAPYVDTKRITVTG